VDEIGKTREEIARSFASAIPKKSTVIIPEEEIYPVIQQEAERAEAKLLPVPQKLSVGGELIGEEVPACAFEQNYRIALAVTEILGKDPVKAYGAAKKAPPDFGGLKVWQAKKDSPLSGWYFVSAFAANDPETTKDVLSRLEHRGLFAGRKRIGLLNLRKDRGGRTMQWYDALQEEGAYPFDRLVIAGEHAFALRDKLKARTKYEVTVVKEKNPVDWEAYISTLEKEEAVVFGMGNMGGLGRLLVDHWERTGNPYDV
jgi:poly-gamma-glutamate synthase PgsB/CapB